MYNAYLAMGDSTTTGFGNWTAPVGLRSWTDLVALSLRAGQPELRYRNVAHNGATARVLLRRQVPVLTSFRPELVSLTVGANDARAFDWSPARFARELDRILGHIELAEARALTVTYPDIAGALAVARRETAPVWRLAVGRLREVNAIIRDVGARHGALLLDMEDSAAAHDPRYLSADFTHPSAEGYRLAADAALRLLAERFAEVALSVTV